MTDIPEWLRNPPGLVEAATAWVANGNAQPAINWLEQTQDIDAQGVSGIWRRDPATGEFRSAASLSVRYPTIHIDMTRRQAE